MHVLSVNKIHFSIAMRDRLPSLIAMPLGAHPPTLLLQRYLHRAPENAEPPRRIALNVLPSATRAPTENARWLNEDRGKRLLEARNRCRCFPLAQRTGAKI